MGYSDELVGKAIKGIRDKVVIATKCGMRWNSDEGSDPWEQKDNQGNPVTIRRNAKPASIAYECELSLKRLGIDVIDLYQIHWPDKTTAVEDSMAAMVKLKDQGKIRAIGVSNYDREWLSRAAKVAPLASLQPPYSLIQRKIEAEILPFCREHHIGVIVYSPLERGLLTGKVGPDREFPPGDHRAALDRVRGIADRHKASLAQLVINWTVHQPGITAALVGARNAEQAAHNAGALNFTLSEQELAEIRKAFDQPAKELNA
jgi:aryl-alcohol dehydrogenase-like predicted oxidoreductase